MKEGIATRARPWLVLMVALPLLLAACAADDTVPDDDDDVAEEQSPDEETPPADDDDANAVELSESIDLAFATLDQGSAWYSYGVSMSQVLEGDFPEGSLVEVLPHSGAIGNPELVASTGEADVALTFSAVAAWAYSGEPETPFEGAPLDDVRVLVGGLDQYYFGPIAPADAPFDSLRQVADDQMGIALVSQPRGSLGDAGTRLILGAYGVSIEDIEQWGGSFEPTSTDVASNAIRDGHAQLWIQAITAGHPAISELAETADIKILDVEESVIAELADLGLAEATLPAGTFRGQEEDVRLLGFKTAVITSAALDEDVAYVITRSIVENAEALKGANESMRPFEPSEAWTDENTGGVPLHPGAEAYYRDAGVMD